MGTSQVDDVGFGEEISQVRHVTKLASATDRDDIMHK